MKRNITLDHYKIILSITIIYFHHFLPLSYDPGFYIDNLGVPIYVILREVEGVLRIGVPSFFIINGYFLNLSDRKKVIKYLIKILKIYLVWTLFYLPWMPHDKPLLFILNLLLGFYHLWYLVALIVSVIALYFIQKILKNKFILLIFTISLFFIGYYIQTSVDTSNLKIHYLYRNGIFFGLPYLTLGFLIQKLDFSIHKNKFTYLLPAIIIIILTAFFETYVYMFNGKSFDIYISSLFLAPLLFIYVLKISKIGQIQDLNISNLSSAIYYIHPFILLTSFLYIPKTDTSILFQFPYLVIISIFFSFVIMQTNKYIKIFI